MTYKYDLLMPKHKPVSIEKMIRNGFNQDDAALIQWRDQKKYEAAIAQSVIDMRGQLQILEERAEAFEKIAKWLAQELLTRCSDWHSTEDIFDAACNAIDRQSYPRIGVDPTQQGIDQCHSQ